MYTKKTNYKSEIKVSRRMFKCISCRDCPPICLHSPGTNVWQLKPRDDERYSQSQPIQIQNAFTHISLTHSLTCSVSQWVSEMLTHSVASSLGYSQAVLITQLVGSSFESSVDLLSLSVKPIDDGLLCRWAEV